MVKGEIKKTALVTGGNWGIGLATARALWGLMSVFLSVPEISTKEGRRLVTSAPKWSTRSDR